MSTGRCSTGNHELVAGKRRTSRLAFALMLKFYARHGRFPDSDGDLPGEVVEFVARQVQVPSEQMLGYEFAGRTVEYYRAQIRGHFGFRECTVEDAQALEAFAGNEFLMTSWVADNPRPIVLDRS